jgi:NitT/TauT family transport system ATP-binding protein
MSEIRFEHVSRRFGRFTALDDVDLTIQNREFVAIVGPSGCGKTTLMRMVAGLEFPTAGRVLVGGDKVIGPGPDRGVVFQQFALFPWKTVWENIAFGLRCNVHSGYKLKHTVGSYIYLMNLQGHEHAYPHQLSGGCNSASQLHEAMPLIRRFC